MHNRDKYPAIWAEKEAAEAELTKLMAERKIHTEAISNINKNIADVVTKAEEEQKKLNILAMRDIDRIKELNSMISRFAIAMGAVTASRGE